MELSHCLYLSRFSGTIGDTGLRDLLKQARENNQARAITGALLFDGERFVQLIEGPVADMAELVQRLCSDRRHHDVTVVSEGPIAARRCRRWTAGYVEIDRVDQFERCLGLPPGAHAGVSNEAALTAFDALLASADVE